MAEEQNEQRREGTGDPERKSATEFKDEVVASKQEAKARLDKEAEENREAPEPRYVRGPGRAYTGEGEAPKHSSAHPMYVAQPEDGRWGTEAEDEPATEAETAAAFEEYVQRPDVESRESILARNNALPNKVIKTPAADKNNFTNE